MGLSGFVVFISVILLIISQLPVQEGDHFFDESLEIENRELSASTDLYSIECEEIGCGYEVLFQRWN